MKEAMNPNAGPGDSHPLDKMDADSVAFMKMQPPPPSVPLTLVEAKGLSKRAPGDPA